MGMLQEILAFNEEFVRNQEYVKYQSSRFPDKKLVILSCMDTRLTELLPKALNLRNGDAKIIKNAGAIVTHPFGSVMRSILVAVYELEAEEICVIGHYGCGMSSIEPKKTIQTMIDRGISKEVVVTLERAGIHLESWMHGFDDVEDSVRQSVDVIKHHPLMLQDTPVHGLVIDPETGKLTLVVNGYHNP